MLTLTTLAIRQILVELRWPFRFMVVVLPTLFVIIFSYFASERGFSNLDSRLIDGMYLVVILPIVAIKAAIATTTMGTAAGTLLFLKSHPISPWQLATSNLVATGFVTTAFLLPSVLIAAAAVTSASMSGGLILGLTFGTVVGSLLYGALTATAGLLFQRPALAGLLYVISIEHFLTDRIAVLRWISVREYMIAWMTGVTHEIGPNIGRPVLSTTSAILGSVLFLAALIGYSTGRLSVLEATDGG